MARFTIPRNIFYGPGSMKELANIKDRKRAFIVTDGVMPKLGLLEKLENILQGAGMETCSYKMTLLLKPSWMERSKCVRLTLTSSSH